jgi:hypothetical protein
MAPCNAKTKLEKARALISLAPLSNGEPKGQELDTSKKAKTWQEMLQALTGRDLTTCPQCGTGNLIRFKLSVSEQPRLPPIWDSS